MLLEPRHFHAVITVYEPNALDDLAMVIGFMYIREHDLISKVMGD